MPADGEELVQGEKKLIYHKFHQFPAVDYTQTLTWQTDNDGAVWIGEGGKEAVKQTASGELVVPPWVTILVKKAYVLLEKELSS